VKRQTLQVGRLNAMLKVVTSTMLLRKCLLRALSEILMLRIAVLISPCSGCGDGIFVFMITRGGVVVVVIVIVSKHQSVVIMLG
jgi:hypothetical protein